MLWDEAIIYIVLLVVPLQETNRVSLRKYHSLNDVH
jgi:hypothetical protein